MARAETGQPAAGATALLVIDMINDRDFEGAEDLRPAAPAAAGVIVGLRRQADRRGVPVVHVNDNFGHWHSQRGKLAGGRLHA